MNSEEEKALFEEYGWQYNYIDRQWEDPDQRHIISNDMLREFNESRESEEELRRLIRVWGNKRNEHNS